MPSMKICFYLFSGRCTIQCLFYYNDCSSNCRGPFGRSRYIHSAFRQKTFPCCAEKISALLDSSFHLEICSIALHILYIYSRNSFWFLARVSDQLLVIVVQFLFKVVVQPEASEAISGVVFRMSNL